VPHAETLMRHLGWLVSATVIVALSGIAIADPPLDPAVDARIKALEERVAQLENRLTAVTNAQKAAATAAATATPAPTAITPAQAAGQVTPPPVPSSVSLSRWKDPAAWSLIKVGMSWSQVTAVLGSPGDKTTGVFGDVWFYPDSSGGRVVFDRDSRVSSWNSPSGASGGQ
jgi:outer membrane protein assembly factor BamE (lipoprotein component of BamABCDE complex)